MRRTTGFVTPDRDRSSITRALAMMLMVGIEDLGQEFMPLPVDDIGYRLPDQVGVCPFGRLRVEIRDDSPGFEAVCIGKDILQRGHFQFHTLTGAWAWTYPRDTPIPREWAKIVARP